MEPTSKHEIAGEDLHDLREAAVQVVKKLVDSGFIAYFAGGCVRDRLMGHEPTDYDVATNATPRDVAKIFPKVQTVGESFGVMLVRVRGHTIQVATFRTEGVYSDGRHPDTVSFSDAQHDASRRDFTINGLFENPLTGEVIDYVGGRADLEKRVIRAIGDPHARLREDRLRMLRAVRFAARFGFSIEPETADAIRAGADQLQGVSRERIGQEVERMLSDANRAVAAWEMQSLGLDAQVLQESSMRVPLTRLSNLPDDAPYPTAAAAWLLDRHEPSGQGLLATAGQWSDALMHSNEHRWAVHEALRVYTSLVTDWSRLGVAEQKRLAASAGFDQGLLLLQATDRDRYTQVRRRLVELGRSGIAPAPLIDGTDLIALGLKPGPLFSRVLSGVYDAQLEGAISGKAEAVEMARTLARNFGNG
jgi:poly(A) polymerase